MAAIGNDPPVVSDRCGGQKYHELLTERERDVVLHLIRRLSDSEIATSLGVAVNTVKYHKKNIYSKWGVKRRADAIAFFHRSSNK